MLDLASCILIWLLAIVTCEFVLAGRKVQTGLWRAAWVYAVMGALLLLWMGPGRVGVAVLVVYWAGAFLTWFCVRSHIESSILLRLLYLLRAGPLPALELLERYEQLYGHGQRLGELVRAGLVERQGAETHLTRKGALILRITARWR